MKENAKTTPPFLTSSQPQEWYPPTPPWSPEPEPLELSGNDSKQPDLKVHPSTFYNGKPVGEEFNQESEDVNGTELDGFFFYRILSPSGVTLNGTPYPQGAYWFNQETYEEIERIDAPFQK